MYEEYVLMYGAVAIMFIGAVLLCLSPCLCPIICGTAAGTSCALCCRPSESHIYNNVPLYQPSYTSGRVIYI